MSEAPDDSLLPEPAPPAPEPSLWPWGWPAPLRAAVSAAAALAALLLPFLAGLIVFLREARLGRGGGLWGGWLAATLALTPLALRVPAAVHARLGLAYVSCAGLVATVLAYASVASYSSELGDGEFWTCGVGGLGLATLLWLWTRPDPVRSGTYLLIAALLALLAVPLALAAAVFLLYACGFEYHMMGSGARLHVLGLELSSPALGLVASSPGLAAGLCLSWGSWKATYDPARHAPPAPRRHPWRPPLGHPDHRE